MKKFMKVFAVVVAAASLFVMAGCSQPDGGSKTYIGSKAPSKAKAVGDIVFNDGSATPYVDGLELTDTQKDAAIAVIFYVGTNCSNDSKSRTLGVGLKHAIENNGLCLARQTSNTDQASAFFIELPSIVCTPSAKTEDITFTGDKNGSDNFAQIKQILIDNSDLEDDTDTAGNYPAFEFANAYDETVSNLGNYNKNWYIPTIAELYEVSKAKATINAAYGLCGGDLFGDNVSFWSSSSSDEYKTQSFTCNMTSGGNSVSYRSEKKYVCVIREF